PTRTAFVAGGSRSSPAKRAAHTTSTTNGTAASGWSVSTVSGDPPATNTAKPASAATTFTTTSPIEAAASDAPRHPHGVAGARRTRRNATSANAPKHSATNNAPTPPNTAPTGATASSHGRNVPH